MTTTDNTPNLHALNFQYTALKRIADTVKDGMAYIKEQHLQALLADAERTKSERWGVEVDGKKVATVTLAGGKSKPKVASEDQLIEWAQQHRPDLVDTKPRLSLQASTILAAIVEDYIDGQAVTADGEVVPGVEETHGAVYQSVRFTNTKAVDGKAVLGDYITELGLAGLIEDVAAQGGDE